MSTELSGFSFRLEPAPHQARVLRSYAGAVRWVWNTFLREHEDLYLAAKSAGGKPGNGELGYFANSAHLTSLRSRFPWLGAVNRSIQSATLKNLDLAFAAFFKGNGKYPRFKSKQDKQAFRFLEVEQSHIRPDRVKLPGCGWVRFRASRPILGEVRNVTVSLDGDKWDISFCMKGDFRTQNAGADPIGMDFGVAQSVTLSTGEVIQFPTQTERETGKQAFLQRKAAKQIKGSVRRRRTMGRLGKLKRHVSSRVKDCQHKLSTRLAKTHRLLAVDGLKLKQMTKSAKGSPEKPGKNVAAKSGLNRSMLGNAFGQFQLMLAYKAKRAGIELVEVKPAFTSQTCNCCGHVAKESRESQAVFQCVRCGHQSNADQNAAKNILAAGLAVSAQGGMELIPADELRNSRRRVA